MSNHDSTNTSDRATVSASPHPWWALAQMLLLQSREGLPTGMISTDHRGNIHLQLDTPAALNAWYEALKGDGGIAGHAWTDERSNGYLRVFQIVDDWACRDQEEHAHRLHGAVYLSTVIDALEKGPRFSEQLTEHLTAIAS